MKYNVGDIIRIKTVDEMSAYMFVQPESACWVFADQKCEVKEVTDSGYKLQPLDPLMHQVKVGRLRLCNYYWPEVCVTDIRQEEPEDPEKKLAFMKVLTGES